jgi:hypothetical protein
VEFTKWVRQIEITSDIEGIIRILKFKNAFGHINEWSGTHTIPNLGTT